MGQAQKIVLMAAGSRESAGRRWEFGIERRKVHPASPAGASQTERMVDTLLDLRAAYLPAMG